MVTNRNTREYHQSLIETVEQRERCWEEEDGEESNQDDLELFNKFFDLLLGRNPSGSSNEFVRSDST
jgi:hypothetical protein